MSSKKSSMNVKSSGPSRKNSLGKGEDGLINIGEEDESIEEIKLHPNLENSNMAFY